MIYEIRTTTKGKSDPKGRELLEEIKKTLKIRYIDEIKTAKVYRFEGITKKESQSLAKYLLFEPIEQKIAFNKPIFTQGKTVEIAYKPGVMNPESASLVKSAHDLKINVLVAETSTEYSFLPKINKKDLQKILDKLLVNKTIEYLVNTKPKTLLISGKVAKTKIIPIRNLSDEEMMKLSLDKLFLNLEEMKVIQKYFKKLKRDPTDCEIEILAQTWSEHCVHKTFKANLIIDGVKKEPLYTRIKKTANFNKKIILSAFEDNSGAIDFYEGLAISGKVETHNSPSAIEPYGGAMTGSGGVFRDILGTGQGAKPIASTDIFCFAPPNLPQKDLPPGCLPPNFLLRKVVAGVRDYGNRVGIPTNNGSIHFHPDFRAKPTVAVGSYGLIPKKYVAKGIPKSGDLIITIGGRTGRDGIHGATFSSGEMTAKTINISGSAVQIGNAIEEKRIIDLTLALRNKNLIRAITDCGAGGFSSAIGEIAEETGAKVYLEKVPLKYPGLAPWEIFLSESQERMIIVSSANNFKKIQLEAEKLNVEVANIGEITSSKKQEVYWKREKVCNLDMNFMHHGLPQRTMIGAYEKRNIVQTKPKKPSNFNSIWEQVLAHPNVCSKEPIIRMYDHNVQGTTALHPFSGKNYDGPNDGVILRPTYAKNYGFITTHGLNPILNVSDPYWGSVWAITEAVSNYVSIGGDLENAALIDNFIWPYPNEKSLADLNKSVEACYDVAKILKMPFVSGKDSLSSTYKYPNGKSLDIPPVLLISVFGKIPNVKNTASADFKKTNSTLVLIGQSDTNNLGGSSYFDLSNAKGNVPKVDLKNLLKVLNAISKGIQSGKILSAHDISEGGLVSAIAEMAFGADFGANIDISNIPNESGREDYLLFSETAGTFIAEVENKKVAEHIFKGIPHFIIGKTDDSDAIKISFKSKEIANVKINKLKTAWQHPMKEIFHD